MVFYKNLIISELLLDHESILKNLSADNLSESLFLICINSGYKNLMDIYFSGEICKPYVNTSNLTVIALCKDKSDAKDTCVKILQDFFRQNNSLAGFKDKFRQVM